MSEQKVNNKITLEQIIAARNWLNASQDEIAKECGISRSYLCMFEKGKIKSEKLKSKIVDLYEQAGIYFVVDDVSPVPGGKGIIFVKKKSVNKVEEPVNKVKLTPPKPKVVDEPKRGLPRRSKEDHYRMASRIRGQSPYQEDDGSSWDGDTRFRPEYD